MATPSDLAKALADVCDRPEAAELEHRPRLVKRPSNSSRRRTRSTCCAGSSPRAVEAGMLKLPEGVTIDEFKWVRDEWRLETPEEVEARLTRKR